MQYVFDETGRRYLDAFGGIATVSCGHSHPEVVNSVIKQLKLIQHSTILYLNHTISDFAEALVSNLPGDLKVTKKKNTRLNCVIKVFVLGLIDELTSKAKAHDYVGGVFHKFGYGGK